MNPDETSREGRRFVYVCLNEDCLKRGNDGMYADLQKRCAGLDGIEVREYICFGNCDDGANTVVFPDRIWFSGLRSDDAHVIMRYLTEGSRSGKHTGRVDEELAETIWELLALEVSSGEESIG